jgi:hypothetical protein
MVNVIRRAFVDALLTFIYIILVVSFVFSLQQFHDKEDIILIPMAMLLLFVCSASITGFLVFGKPVMLYIDGKKKEAVALLGYTIAILFALTLIVFMCMIGYYWIV